MEGWLLHFEGICVAGGVNEDAQKIALLTVSTSGEATRWVRARSRWLFDEDRTWNEIKDAFRERFLEDDIEDQVNAALKTLRQREGESVKEYVSRFRELLARSDEATEDAWYRSWVDGLREPLREAVKFIGYRDLESAAEIATRKECASRSVDLESELPPVNDRHEVGAELLDALGEWALRARTRGSARQARMGQLDGANAGPQPREGGAR